MQRDEDRRSCGTSEQYLGRALRDFARREDVVVATKFPVRSDAEIALSWLMAKGAIPVAGATKASHVDGMARAADIRLTDEEQAYLEACYTPHALVGVMAQNR